jgi:hypothetical protein
MLHCVIFLRTTVKPPRSETPFTISSFAKTVPNPGHQNFSLSQVNLYCKGFSLAALLKALQLPAVKPRFYHHKRHLQLHFLSKIEIKVETSSALSLSLLYQELNN